jgi:hypothetical protein
MMMGHPQRPVSLAVGATDRRTSLESLAALMQSPCHLDPVAPRSWCLVTAAAIS